MDHKIFLLIDRPDALSRLANLFIAEWNPWYGPDGKGEAKSDLMKCMNRDRLPIAVVAVSNEGLVLGTAALKLESLGSEYGFSPLMAAVVVDPDFRNYGIGLSLIQMIEEQAEKLAFTEIYTSTDTMSAIVEKLGWERLDQTVQSLRGPIPIFKRVLG